MRKNALLLTSGLASGGVSARGQFSGNLEAHRPLQPYPRPNAKPPDVMCHVGTYQLETEKITTGKF